MLMLYIWLAIAAALVAAQTPMPSASPTVSPQPSPPVHPVTLTPVELASANAAACGGAKVSPPFGHPGGTVLVGALEVPGTGAGAAPTICAAYQGLVRFDLDGLDAASIAKAQLFFAGKQNYDESAASRRHATCVGGIGVTAQNWSSEQKIISPMLTELESVRLRGNVKGPPVDVTALLKAHLAEVKANGLLLDGTVENPAAHRCFAAVGQIELRLGIAGPAP